MTIIICEFCYFIKFFIVIFNLLCFYIYLLFIYSVASLCQNTPQLASAVEIALSGQMYLVEGDYEAAVEKYKIGLNLIEKLLEKEPPGVRYNLLVKHVS